MVPDEQAGGEATEAEAPKEAETTTTETSTEEKSEETAVEGDKPAEDQAAS